MAAYPHSSLTYGPTRLTASFSDCFWTIPCILQTKFLLSSPFCPRCECVCAGACVFLCTVCLYVQVHSPTQVLGKTTGWHRLSPSVTLYLVFLRQGLPGVSCFGQQLLGPACLCLSQHRNVKPKVPFSDFKCTLGTWGTQACRASIFSHRTISLAF